MQRRNDNIHITDLALSNHKNVLSVSVAYNQRRGRIELRIQPLERNPGGCVMVSLFGGPYAAYEYLADCGRFSEKKLVAIAAEIKENGKDSEEFGEIYETALGNVLTKNGYVLAFRDSQTGEYVDAYKPVEFEVGQRVEVGKLSASTEPEYGWIVDKGVERFGSKIEYTVILDSMWMRTVKADDDYTPIVASGDARLDVTEVAELVAKYNQAVIDRKQAKADEEAAKAKAFSESLAGVRQEFPWAKQDGSEYARGAANLKTQLQMAFPGVDFSVKSSSASMTDSITVSWTDGPTQAQVNEFADRYQYGGFDSYTDTSTYRQTDKEFRTWMGQAKHVNCYREYSEAIVGAVTDDLRKYDDQNVGHRGNWASDLLHKVGIYGEYTGLEVVDGEYIPQFTRRELPPVASGANIGAWPSGNGVTVRENPAKSGIEVKFAAKPEPSVLSDLKAHGFRWSKFKRLWWSKDNDRARKFAYGLAGGTAKASEAATPDYFDMQVEDNMAAARFA